MTNLKKAMKLAKKTGKSQKVTEPTEVKSIKVNTSIRLDLDTLNWLKAEGARQGLPYQTLANSLLKRAMLTNGSIEERLEKIEKAVFKGKAG